MAEIFISPRRYIQGPGELSRIGRHIKNLFTRDEGIPELLVVLSKSGKQRFGDTVFASLAEAGLSCTLEIFGGESSQTEIDRLCAVARKSGARVIVGLGGGKALDSAKATADILNLPAVVIPTIAASDAPCSALAVIYKESGEFERLFPLKTNPDLVLVDSEIIANAPARLLSAGMGDALATYFESQAAYASGARTMAGGQVTQAASAIARRCYDILITDGEAALRSVENKQLSQSLENVIEANILLSGIGFESGGTAAAHPIGNGLTELPECHHLYHGEKVAFATIVQLVMQDSPPELIREVVRFCKSVNLPVCFRDLGIEDVTDEQIRTVAKLAVMPEESMHNMPFPVTQETVEAALRVTMD